MEPFMVVKRDGQSAEYDGVRIVRAIEKAAEATGQTLDEAELARLVAVLEADLRSLEAPPRVEDIQDRVETALIAQGWAAVAKAYILYRAERGREREVRKQQLREAAWTGGLVIRAADGTQRTLHAQDLRTRLEAHVAALGDAVVPGDLDLGLVVDQTLATLYEGAGEGDVDRALVLACAAYMERDPAYDHLGASLFLDGWLGGLGIDALDQGVKGAYTRAFVQGIRQGVAAGQLDPRLGEGDLEAVAGILDPGYDRLLDFQGLETLHERYALRVEGRVVESPQGFWLRVALGLSLADRDQGLGGSELDTRVESYYRVMATLRFVPSTPTLFHAGTTRPQLSSCYLTTVNDDLGHIFKSMGDTAQLSKYSGGIGTDWTRIRGTGSLIQSIQVPSQGVIPFLKIANDTTHAINRSGKRRGAACAYLEAWHLDFEDFLDLRRNTGDERRRTHDLNTAAWIPDLFMKRVQEEGSWTFFSPDEVPDLHGSYGRDFEARYRAYEEKAAQGEMALHRSVEAVKLWRKILTRLFETGHPWITFKDPCNLRNPQGHVGVINHSNLCTEITLNTSDEETAVCNLGSINLAAFLSHDGDGKPFLDRKALERVIPVAVRMLDNVIDINFYPVPEARTANMRHRPVGLGLMGFQDLLLGLGLAYEDPEALNLARETMETISYHAILASTTLAAVRGAYPSYKGSTWDQGLMPQDTVALLEADRGEALVLPGGQPLERRETLDWSVVRRAVRDHGMRNSNLMAIAPTATISTIAGSYPSFEPLYKNLYIKANMSGEYTVLNRHLVADLKARGLWNQGTLDRLKAADGRLEGLEGIPAELKRIHREAFDVPPLVQVAYTALRQVWIDQSQSHNIFLRGSSGKELSEIYQAAWKAGLKTTYYLRTLGASTVEKSTLDAKTHGFTQKRKLEVMEAAAPACSVLDPGCESCQ